MKQEDMVKALAKLEGWEFRKSSSPYQCDGWWSPDERGPFDERGMTIDSGLHLASKSYDYIIPLIKKHEFQFLIENLVKDLWNIPCSLSATPAQLCEALLRAAGRWQE